MEEDFMDFLDLFFVSEEIDFFFSCLWVVGNVLFVKKSSEMVDRDDNCDI